MIVPVFSILSTAAPVTAIVGQNAIWQDTLPQKFGDKRRYITWAIVGGAPENYLDEVPTFDSGRVQLDCWADEAKVCRDLMIASRNAIEPHAHMLGTPMSMYEPESKLYRYLLEFQFWERR